MNNITLKSNNSPPAKGNKNLAPPLNLIAFPIERTKKQRTIQNETKANNLLREFVNFCLITDPDKQRVAFTELREAIFNHVSNLK